MNQQHDWAVESLQLLQEEMAMIHHFYEIEDNKKEMQKEIDDVEARLQPQITYDVISGGIIYLQESFLSSN